MGFVSTDADEEDIAAPVFVSLTLVLVSIPLSPVPKVVPPSPIGLSFVARVVTCFAVFFRGLTND